MIIWDEKKPTSPHEPASRGKILGGYIEIKTFWNNTGSYFYSSIFGYEEHDRVPGEFNTLAQARAAAETFVTELINNAATKARSELLIYILLEYIDYVERASQSIPLILNKERMKYLIDQFVLNRVWEKSQYDDTSGFDSKDAGQ